MVVALILLLLQVKVAGVEFLPKNVIFPSPDERSRSTAEGALSAGCKWALRTETRVGQNNDARECVIYFYRTTVSLSKRCGERTDEAAPLAQSATERTMIAGQSCPGSTFTPRFEAKILSVGTNSDGRRQEIVLQPDGTRVVILTEFSAVTVNVSFPDGTADTLAFK